MKVLVQRLRPIDHVGHRVVLPIPFFRQARADGRLRSSKWSGHSSSMFSNRSKSASLSFVLVDDQLALFGSRRVGISRLDRFGRQIGILFDQLQRLVFLHFLFDPFLQGHDRQLQDFHRLDHARREHLLLNQPQFLSEGKSHEDPSVSIDDGVSGIHRQNRFGR